MPYAIDDALATALVTLHPHAARHAADPVRDALQRLLDEEHARRGVPDATGALSFRALTQGTLLKEEFDLSTHAHHAGWTVGALIVDVKGMIHVNVQHGFAVGDALLKSVVSALRAQWPDARVVRLQGDNFAVLLVPSSGLSVSEEMRESARARLAHEVRAALPEGADVPGFTLALLELTIEEPTHWQVLGPLVWGELMRAYTLQERGLAGGLQHRRLRLGGFIPEKADP
ncbi:diguanylate cyclase domain-containing protein [Melittangium boletus]|uniref:Diguanylate cyclase n=1 Tax=Melittangium boletus DSM 14713 TaxID=1294270 RepID=A0A250ILA5_9BACT|nr:diguanylate cyclase [Melittangium boletus]ATB32012.1 diguanylate cyclase [Melittangium boletus DSM 14713]